MAEDDSAPSVRTLAVRAAVGFAQGLALYGLYHWRKQIDPVAFGALGVTAWLAPIVFLGVFGAASRRTVVAWTAAAVVVTAVLGGYGAFARQGHPPIWNDDDFLVILFTAAALYILHHLIVPADAERRWRASYLRYFDEGWMDAVRLALSGLFVGLLWLLLWLGAVLFTLIGLHFLQELIEKDWFAYPATTTFFALAIHLTDVRVGLVRGARTLLLTLLSWLLTVMTVITVGFLAALPFTGLVALRAAGSSSGVMLAVCAALIILLNATYQEGEHDGQPPMALKWLARVAALALVPLVAVAVYGLALRIGQHGLTPKRIYFAACLVAAACYAVGYARAAVGRGRWMGPLEATNWLTAQVIVVLLLALFSPIVDPARISVGDQVARLNSGAVAPAKFDFSFLRFNSGRWGRAALAQLAAMKGAGRPDEIAARAHKAQLAKSPWEEPELVTADDRTKRLKLIAGSAFPAGFIDQAWSTQDPANGCQPSDPCPVLVADIDGEPGPEAIVFRPYNAAVYGQRNGHWSLVGFLGGPFCRDDLEAIKKGDVRPTPATPHNDVAIGGRRFALELAKSCPSPNGGAEPVDDEVTDVSLIQPVPEPPPPKPAAAGAKK
jgi:hypothetical protein